MQMRATDQPIIHTVVSRFSWRSAVVPDGDRVLGLQLFQHAPERFGGVPSQNVCPGGIGSRIMPGNRFHKYIISVNRWVERPTRFEVQSRSKPYIARLIVRLARLAESGKLNGNSLHRIGHRRESCPICYVRSCQLCRSSSTQNSRHISGSSDFGTAIEVAK